MVSKSFPVGGDEQFVLYEDRPDYHCLLLNIPPDNRLTPDTVPAIIEAVTYIRTNGEAKPLITTSTSPKYFSNGLDFNLAVSTLNFFDEMYYPLLRVFVEFPWPTIAFVNGHAFAAGFMIAACHDYIVMNSTRGYLCMNEVEFGAPLMGALMSIFRVKYGVKIAQKITMTAHRYTSEEALKDGIITARGGLPEAEEIASSVAKFAQSPSYGQIRKELLRELILDLKTYHEDDELQERNRLFENDFYAGVIAKMKAKM